MPDGNPFAHGLGTASRTPPTGPIHLEFDVSDLVAYFHHARLSTGIQRVQTEVARTLLADRSASVGVGLVCFVPAINAWARVPQYQFQALTLVAGRAATPAPPIGRRPSKPSGVTWTRRRRMTSCAAPG